MGKVAQTFTQRRTQAIALEREVQNLRRLQQLFTAHVRAETSITVPREVLHSPTEGDGIRLQTLDNGDVRVSYVAGEPEQA